MKNSTLPIRFGLVTAAVLVAYFLILSLFNKHTNIFYSLFNGVITGFGIYETIKYLKLKDGNKFDYGRGFKFGLTTGVVATLLFTFFFMVYSTELNPLFLEQLSAVWAKDYSNFTAIVFFTVAIMGMATSLVLTLSFMQLFKSSKNILSKA
ncbi:DUF4199 domain-containing protein [Flavobacterium sp. ASW18X]|uniref:DUF4199 domain-containing protein n=1 Tax=Flavobacterium sp. ASW18X TaxID=2572595 RepID=UPI0010AE5F45|nr:DUF4199 domain-containing protein [Flavobacterium sp. ASW18X]TKD65359.1 DUF4199 domain-containing protein [Flavobacterium sp. ASW18X]